MAPSLFDPWHAETRTAWRNRCDDWRAAPAEPVWHAIALLGLAALLLPLGWDLLQSLGPQARRWLATWWPAALAALLVGQLVWQRRRRRIATQRRRRGWLAVQPVTTVVERRNDRRHALHGAAVQAVLCGAVALALDVSPSLQLAAAAIPLAAAAAALCLPLTARSTGHGIDSRRDLLWLSSGAGRVWRWQLIEIGSLFAPKRLALLFLSALLVPAGLALPTAVAAAVLLMLLAGFVAAWQRSLAVLPAAQRWLAAQPLRPGRLLRAWIALPALQLAVATTLLVTALPLLDATTLRLPAALGLLAVAALQVGCVAAERHRPLRGTLLFAVQLTLLLATLQALPPLVLLVWPLQLGWLIRRSLR